MEDQNRSQKAWITVQEVSALLRIPLSTVYQLTQRGKLPAVKVGRHWRYLAQEVQVFLNCGRPSLYEGKLGHNKRRFARLNCTLTARLANRLVQDQVHPAQGWVQNVSEGGVFFQCSPEGFKLDDPVRLSFVIPGGPSHSLEMEGRIVWRSDAGREGFGIKFRRIGREERRILRNYVG